MTVNAVTHHKPEMAAELIDKAVAAVGGTQAELSRRLGLSRQTIYFTRRGDVEMSYTLQLALESVIRDQPPEPTGEA